MVNRIAHVQCGFDPETHISCKLYGFIMAMLFLIALPFQLVNWIERNVWKEGKRTPFHLVQKAWALKVKCRDFAFHPFLLGDTTFGDAFLNLPTPKLLLEVDKNLVLA
ncbi:hypothetical protein VNO77_18806 [Canavalia gladiata]|uniref:Uncharacterized protein n=1 Tax=Canavalia gladiata TaxID=3824 RepID=A0AAN9LLH5_CANGL